MLISHFSFFFFFFRNLSLLSLSSFLLPLPTTPDDHGKLETTKTIKKKKNVKNQTNYLQLYYFGLLYKKLSIRPSYGASLSQHMSLIDILGLLKVREALYETISLNTFFRYTSNSIS